jgi:hypothetical protein
VRTTVTLDPDVAALLQRAMRQRGLTFKQALNDALRAAMSGEDQRKPIETPTFDMGRPTVPLEHALRLAAELDDGDTRRQLDAAR